MIGLPLPYLATLLKLTACTAHHDLQKEPIGIALTARIRIERRQVGAIRQEMLADAAHFLDRGIVVQIGVEHDGDVARNLMRRSGAGGKMAFGRAWLTGDIVRTTRLHLLIASAHFPANRHEPDRFA